MYKTPSNKSFGYVFSIFFLILAIFFFENIFDLKTLLLLVLSFIFFILGFFNAKFLQPFNNLWTKLGILLGRIISPIVMFIVYFGTIFPIKILIILFGKDLLSLKYSRNKDSYWVLRKDKTNLKDQF